MGMRGCAQVCVDMHGCGMNFQNFFWRIESLHQRTLIRILYEFFVCILLSRILTANLMLITSLYLTNVSLCTIMHENV